MDHLHRQISQLRERTLLPEVEVKGICEQAKAILTGRAQRGVVLIHARLDGTNSAAHRPIRGLRSSALEISDPHLVVGCLSMPPFLLLALPRPAPASPERACRACQCQEVKGCRLHVAIGHVDTAA